MNTFKIPKTQKTTKSGKRIWYHKTYKTKRKGKALGIVQRIYKRKTDYEY